jgi:hypothetical protein
MKVYNKLVIVMGKIVLAQRPAVLRLLVVVSLPSGKFRHATSKNTV